MTREGVANQHIAIVYVFIVKEVVDILTKGLPTIKFQRFCALMGMVGEH